MTLQGYLFCDYFSLRRAFGIPKKNTDKLERFRVTWDIMVNGQEVSIYDWRETKPVSKVKEWNLGSINSKFFKAFDDLLFERTGKRYQIIFSVFAT